MAHLRARLSPGLPLIVTLALIVVGCPRPQRPPITRPEEALVEPSGPVALRDDGDLAGLRVAIAESVTWLDSQPPERALVFGKRTIPVRELRAALARLHERTREAMRPEELEALIRADFDLLEAAGGADGTVLFTGYYEPVIEGSLTPSEEFSTPVHGLPADLVEIPLESFSERFKGEKVYGRLEGQRVVPYWSRAEIVAGRLANEGLEIAWVKDPVALFFVQVQGSGVLVLPDGTERRIGYAAANGRPYRSIGAKLIERGAIPREQMSMQALRAWLAAHPEERDRLLDYNESYVFFRFLPGAAVGSLGRPVTPGRSIATDARLLPRGALAFVQTERPIAREDGRIEWRPLSRFMLNQDTGGAIRGAGRVDVFWGRGPEAELAAGMMKQKGRLLFLVPKPRG